MAHHKGPIPLDVFHRILFFIPSTETNTLACLLRLDKACCLAVAPKLYTHVKITPDADLLVDTGLLASVVYDSASTLPGIEATDGDSRARKLEQKEGKEAETGRAAQDALEHVQTLKARMLSLIRTIDIHPCSQPTKPQADVISTVTLQRRSIPLLHLDKVTVRLDISHPARLSPFAPYEPPSGLPNAACIPLLKDVRPRRVVIRGASFMMTVRTNLRLPHSMFEHVQEVVIVVTAGAVPDDTPTQRDYGLIYIYQNVALTAGTASSGPDSGSPSLPRSTTMTFLLQTSKPADRFKLVHRPHSNMAMTMEYHPDYAPGYLNPLTLQLACAISVDWKKAVKENGGGGKEDRRRKVNFVNFGSLDGEEFGMPQAAKEEVEDRFRRGMNIRMKQNVSRLRIFDNMEIGDKWEDDVKVLGMKEWLDGSKERRDVLDEYIWKAWL